MLDAVRLEAGGGRLAVEVVPYGLTIHSIQCVHAGRVHDLVVGPASAAGHASCGRQFCGAVVGRYANRLPAGTHEISPGNHARLREWGGAGISHHGGPLPAAAAGPKQRGPFDTVEWSVLGGGDAQYYAAHDVAAMDTHAVFAHESPHGDQGYPGHIRIEALVGVREDAAGRGAGVVRVEYRARLFGTDVAATPLNMAQHWGFNLSASDPATCGDSVDRHVVQLGARGEALQRVAVDERGLATGTLVPCTAATPAHDWKGGKAIAVDIPPAGYDDFYVWGSATARGRPVAALHAPTGLSLSFRTNQAGVQVYTMNSAPPAQMGTKPQHRAAGRADGYRERDGVFLEFAAPHATFLHEEFWNMAGSDTLLRPGETYVNWVEVAVRTGDAGTGLP
ncbi:aldose 1-epimerase [Malassezia sp. CBS 17886]|nr:aldose 1-epimerase [Malassezia sp. CBS 17886]